MFLTHIIYFSLGTKRITFIILFVCVGVERDSHNIHALYGKEQFLQNDNLKQKKKKNCYTEKRNYHIILE